MHDASATTTRELKQKLQHHLDLARQKIDELQHELDAARSDTVEALQQKSDELRKRVQAQKERAQEVRANLDDWRREQASQSREAVASWRQRREIHKLESRADRAEDYAINAVIVAVMDMDAANEAVLDALHARLDADLAGAGAAPSS